MTPSVQPVDVLIVGAGMAGLTMALAVSHLPSTIRIIDPKPPQTAQQWSPQFDPRVSALTQASESMLRNLGVWPVMEQHRVAPFLDMDVWDREGTGNIQFCAREVGAKRLGCIVENRVTSACLFEQVQQADNIEFQGLGLARVLESDCGWLVELDNGEQIAPKLLIAADGARSRVRDQLGFRCRTWDYGQQALVTTVTTEKPHGDCARQVFLETGPLAFLPLRQTTDQKRSQISSIVWTTTPDQAQTLLAKTDGEFCKELGFAFEHRLGKILEVESRHCFPLQQNHAVDYVMPGVALIGDAAHSIHPLAGQGINMGLLDAAVLAEEIERAVNLELPLEDFSVLRRYQRRRKPQNLLMMSTMEGFKRLFGTGLPPLRVARNMGMSLLNGHTLIKGQILSRAMGLEGDLPQLARAPLLADF